jgi:outer membrane protein assembly factor BamB
VYIPLLILAACGLPKTIPAITERSIREDGLGVTKIWRVSPLLVSSDGHQFANIVLTPEYLILNDNYSGVIDGGKLIAFTTATGLTGWETKYNRSVASLVADQEKLYVASAGNPLQAYSLETGKLVWSGPKLRSRVLHALRIQNNTLVDISGVIQSFNLETGELLREEDFRTDNVSSFIMRLGEFDLRQTDKGLIKVRQSGEVVWQMPFLGKPSGLAREFPFLSGNRLIAVVGRVGLDLYVIDFDTGQRLWKAPGTYVSNAAVVKGKVYILRDDARLMVFDELTGAELGYIQFTTPVDTGRSSYWVGVDDQGRMFVYFSDSGELIALK